MDRIRKLVIATTLTLCVSQLGAQEPRARTAPQSIYAMSAAGLGSAMTYCMAKYGPLREGSRASDCYAGARAVLARTDVRRHAQQADARCADPVSFNQCITPEVGRFVYLLNSEFDKQNL